MKNFTKISGSALALALLIGTGAPAASADEHNAPNVITAVVEDESFQGLEDTLLLADDIADAGLIPTIDNIEADITIFAPTNKAFENLPKALLRAIENDPGILVSILSYHVAPGALYAADVVAQKNITTLVEDDDIQVRTPGNNVFLNISKVVETDIKLTNAAGKEVVVHRINKVMVPWQTILYDVLDALKHK